MRPTSPRSLVLVAAAALTLSACAGRQDPSIDTTTTGAGLGTFGEPTTPSVVQGPGVGQQPYTLGSDQVGGQTYTSTGTIEGTAIDGIGQNGLYGADTGLVDGGIISAAPQYTDGTIYTDATTYDDVTSYDNGTFTQPYDATLFDNTAVGTVANNTGFSTNPGGASLNGYSFPGDTGQQSYLTTQVGNRVLFETDSVILTADARETLRRQAAWLQLHPEHAMVILEGHADERGTREYNLALGARRADAVRAYLSSLGIPASRLRTVSYGKERPLSLGSSPGDWAKNRRVETVLGGGASF